MDLFGDPLKDNDNDANMKAGLKIYCGLRMENLHNQIYTQHLISQYMLPDPSKEALLFFLSLIHI